MRHWRRIAGVAACASLIALPAGAALRAAGNGFLSVEVQDAGADIGMFSIRTGTLHPRPEQSVLFAVGTSYVTLRDNTAQEVWTNAGTIVNTDIAPYVFRSMQSPPASTSIQDLPNGFLVTYVLPSWTVRQEFVVIGVALADTRVQHSIMVTNTSTVARSYGVRNLWDWDLGGVDALWFRPLVAAAAYTQTFFAQTTPVFHAFEHVDDPAMPTFHAYGTVRDGLLNATPPDRFGYVAWLDLFEAPWDTPVINDALDSATVHYWGFVAPLVLTPGASATFRQYASTSATAIGTASDAVAEVTTLSYAALSMLAILLLTAASVTKSCRSITAA